MNQLYKQVSLNEESAVSQRWELPHFYPSVHLHPIYQLTFIEKGKGTFYSGENFCSFKDGDIFLIGPFLPHVFLDHDSEYVEGARIKAVNIFFVKEYLEKVFSTIPEAESVRKLLCDSMNCVKVGTQIRKTVSDSMKHLVDDDVTGFEKVVSIMWILHRISHDYQTFSSFSQKRISSAANRVERLYEYTSRNYDKKIEIKDVASMVSMTEPGFCRFFKHATGKSYIEFLIELRVGMSARYMMEEEIPLSDIAARVGFTSVANFIKQFKKVMGVTPSDFRAEM